LHLNDDVVQDDGTAFHNTNESASDGPLLISGEIGHGPKLICDDVAIWLLFGWRECSDSLWFYVPWIWIRCFFPANKC